MIHITTVQGNVLIEDVKQRSQEMARNGMTLDSAGNYLIVTNQTSRADVSVDGKVIKLGPSSYLRIQGGRTWWEQHTEFLSGRNVKLFLGKIWARIARDNPDDLGPGGGGIRG